MSRRAEFGLGATFEDDDGSIRNAIDSLHPGHYEGEVPPFERPERPVNKATIAQPGKFSEEYARQAGFEGQDDMRGERW